MRHAVACVVLIQSLVYASGAFAQGQRQQFDELLRQISASPHSVELRERAVKLGTALRPPPALPEETLRHMARGIAAFRAARSWADYQDAVREFEQAAKAAPWHGDAYFNLGLTLDRAGHYDAALTNLRLALLASPAGNEIKSLMYEVEFRRERAARQPADIRSLAGQWVIRVPPGEISGMRAPGYIDYYRLTVPATAEAQLRRERTVWTDGRVSTYSVEQSGLYAFKGRGSEFQGVYIEGTSEEQWCKGREQPLVARLSPDGKELQLLITRIYGGVAPPGAIPGPVSACGRAHVAEQRRFLLRHEGN